MLGPMNVKKNWNVRTIALAQQCRLYVMLYKIAETNKWGVSVSTNDMDVSSLLNS